MKTINILGINITSSTKAEILEKIRGFLSDNGQHRIVTPNPEIILKAMKDEEYFYTLNTADLAIPDGIGLKFAAWAMGDRLRRMTGVDLTMEVLAIAQELKMKVAVLNWRKGLSKSREIKTALDKRFPALKSAVFDIDREWVMPYYKEVNLFEPEIIFTTLGAPWQDKFNFRALKKMPYAKLAIGVGGSFDFLTGRIARAPRFMRALGLEWLWRLAKQPWRSSRIYNAVFVFSYKFLRWRFILPFRYRPNVACLLFKKEQEQCKILLVERSSMPGHWQLPQGGLDHDNVDVAGAREIHEELGVVKIKPVESFPELHQYEFGDNMSKYNTLAKNVSGYRGQRQSLFIAEYLGSDEEIRLNYWEHRAFKWVEAERMVENLFPTRQEAGRVYYEKFKEIIKQTHET